MIPVSTLKSSGDVAMFVLTPSVIK